MHFETLLTVSHVGGTYLSKRLVSSVRMICIYFQEFVQFSIYLCPRICSNQYIIVPEFVQFSISLSQSLFNSVYLCPGVLVLLTHHCSSCYLIHCSVCILLTSHCSSCNLIHCDVCIIVYCTTIFCYFKQIL